MKKRIIALAVALILILSGCEGMLERSYSASSPHVDKLTTAGDPSVVRVETYRELVSAVLYLVSQGAEEGTIQFHSYSGDVETDLTSACLEVTTQDPLGAYAVDYIKHELSRVVAYDQADLAIHYRRTLEQIRSVSNVTGTSAIRTELQTALANFEEEVVLRVAYLSEDEEALKALVRQAYYDTPSAAMGMPRIDIALYPDAGRQRVVEILLSYPEPAEELKRRNEETAERLSAYGFEGTNTQNMDQADMARYVLGRLPYHVTGYDPGAGGTLYDAVVKERTNSEGFALAYAVYCGQIDGAPTCDVVQGTLGEEVRFLNSLHFSDGSIGYVDPCTGDHDFHTAQELVDMGYRWPGAPVPEEELRMEEQDGPEETTGQETLPE